jgi:hypothetical protein
VIGCPDGLTGTTKGSQGVGLSVFTRYERRGDADARLDGGAAPVEAFVLHGVDADVEGIAFYVG